MTPAGAAPEKIPESRWPSRGARAPPPARPDPATKGQAPRAGDGCQTLRVTRRRPKPALGPGHLCPHGCRVAGTEPTCRHLERRGCGAHAEPGELVLPRLARGVGAEWEAAAEVERPTSTAVQPGQRGLILGVNPGPHAQGSGGA